MTAITHTVPFVGRRAFSPGVRVIGGFVATIALLLVLRQDALLRVLVPILGTAVAIWTYRHLSFAAYLSLAWWFWFIVPGLRRIVDYQAGGWNPENPISLTPFLVSAVAVAAVIRRLPELRRPQLWPWVVAIACLAVGFLAGVLLNGPLPAVHALAEWMTPLLLGLAVAVEWRRYPAIAAVLTRTFVWGVLVLSIYAVIQFLVAPAWDRQWVESSGMTSVGFAFPYRIRVFSLMNGPLSFAVVLLAGMLLALASRGHARVATLTAATVALILTLVRSVWLALPVGIVIYFLALPMRSLRRAAVTGLVACTLALGVPYLLPGDLRESVLQIVTDRAQSLGSLHQDISYNERTSFADQMGVVVLDNPIGHGLGSTGVSSELGDAGTGIRDFDSGILAVLYALGWFAGAAFLAAAVGVVVLGMARREVRADTVAKAARAIAVATLALSLGGNVFEGVSGAVFWTFAGMLMAAHRWSAVASPSARRAEAR